MTRIKICGNTEAAGVDRAVELGVDLLGFIFTRSRRQVSIDQATALLERVPASITRVGVFIDEPTPTIAAVVAACRLDAVQVYRPVTAADRDLPVQWIHALRIRDGFVPPVDARPDELVLADTWTEESDGGGSGQRWDWSAAQPIAERHRLVLSGGLSSENVGEGIAQLQPWGVDVASGVEASPGIKDLDRLTRFVAAVREADR